jgi:hypothetical protein
MAEAVVFVIEKLICYITCVEEKRNTCKIVVEECEGRR